MKEIVQFRTHIENFLQTYVHKQNDDVLFWSADVRKRLLEYSLRGKMIRGSLVFVGAEMAGADHKQFLSQLSAAAAAMELIQSFLLVHDDIMDDDDQRRGMPAIHAQYRDLAVAKKWHDPKHTAVSLGICAGDIAAYMAAEILSELDLPLDTYTQVQRICAKEIILVGTAQMQDVVHGVSANEPQIDDILSVYRYKTGRYTFSLPLMLGWIIGGGDKKTLATIGEMGEAMGIVFQVQDDYLGLFGDTEKTGKPVTSDVAENKKTLYRCMLFDAIDKQGEEYSRVRNMFGQKNVSTDDVIEIREACSFFQVEQAVQSLVNPYYALAKTLIEEVSNNNKSRDVLNRLLEYIGGRVH